MLASEILQSVLHCRTRGPSNGIIACHSLPPEQQRMWSPFRSSDLTAETLITLCAAPAADDDGMMRCSWDAFPAAPTLKTYRRLRSANLGIWPVSVRCAWTKFILMLLLGRSTQGRIYTRLYRPCSNSVQMWGHSRKFSYNRLMYKNLPWI